MNILLLNGSPHEQGCTYTALEIVAASLRDAGVETEMLWIGPAPVRGCIGCDECKASKRCIFGDDLANIIIEKMEQADGLVVGSPVYFASVNGSLLSLLDRVFYAGSVSFACKPGAALVSARRAGTTAALEVLNKYFTIAQMPLISSHYWNMVHGNTPEQVLMDLEGVQTMQQLGRNMAWLLKCIEAGNAQNIARPVVEHRLRTNFIR